MQASCHRSQEQTKEHTLSEVERPACFEAESKTTFEAESRELTMADRPPMMQTITYGQTYPNSQNSNKSQNSGKQSQRAGSQSTNLSRNTGQARKAGAAQGKPQTYLTSSLSQHSKRSRQKKSVTTKSIDLNNSRTSAIEQTHSIPKQKTEIFRPQILGSANACKAGSTKTPIQKPKILKADAKRVAVPPRAPKYTSKSKPQLLAQSLIPGRQRATLLSKVIAQAETKYDCTLEAGPPHHQISNQGFFLNNSASTQSLSSSTYNYNHYLNHDTLFKDHIGDTEERLPTERDEAPAEYMNDKIGDSINIELGPMNLNGQSCHEELDQDQRAEMLSGILTHRTKKLLTEVSEEKEERNDSQRSRKVVEQTEVDGTPDELPLYPGSNTHDFEPIDERNSVEELSHSIGVGSQLAKQMHLLPSTGQGSPDDPYCIDQRRHFADSKCQSDLLATPCEDQREQFLSPQSSRSSGQAPYKQKYIEHLNPHLFQVASQQAPAGEIISLPQQYNTYEHEP